MSKHSEHSAFRERLLDHLFVGELLKFSWQRGDCSLEISTPEVDRAGFDIIAECDGIVRHIQIKAAFRGSSTSQQKVHVALMDKPSGCVVWIYFDEETLEMGPFLYFGGQPGEQLPDITNYRIAKHTKGNAEGVKAERPNLRNVNKGKFMRVETIQELWVTLFG